MSKSHRFWPRGVGLGFVAAAAFALPTASSAQTDAASMPRPRPAITHVPPAGSVCHDCAKPDGVPAANPPAHFNALTASDGELAHYGFPPRPDARKSAADYAFWSKLVTLPVTRVVPKLQATTISNGPNQIRSISQRHVANGPTGTTSGNWSGYAVEDANKPFATKGTYVYGAFVVPVAQQAFGACTGSYDYSSQWIGIDGYNSNDVFQAGIEADAYCNGSTTAAFYSAWYEWYPYSETRISSPPVAPGDLIYVYIWNTSATVGNYYMANFTQGVSSSLQFKAPKGTKLQGDSVEWIVERPGLSTGLATLTNYTDVPWYYARAETAGKKGVNYSPGSAPTGTIYSMTMVDGSNNQISDAFTTPESQLTYTNPSGGTSYYMGTALWFFDEGPAQ